MALNWQFVGEGTFGSLKFLKNGDLDVGGMHFDKTCQLDSCVLGRDGTTLDFADSYAAVRTPTATHHFRFIEGSGWEYARSGPGSTSISSALLWIAGFIVVLVVVACVLRK
jgi:hypothetical protein